MNKLEKDVNEALRKVSLTQVQVQSLTREIARSSFVVKQLKRIQCYKEKLRLLTEANELSYCVYSVRKWTDPWLLLAAGGALYELDDFDAALHCFESLIENETQPNQDIRLTALVGKIECELSLAFGRPRDGLEDSIACNLARTLSEIVRQDLSAAGKGLQLDLVSRLAEIDLAVGLLGGKSRSSSR